MPASRLGHTPLGHEQCRFPRGHKAGLPDVAALVPQDNELASEINARWWKPPHLIREQQFALEAQNGILYSPFGVHYRQQPGLSIGCQRAEQQRPTVIDDTCLSLPNRHLTTEFTGRWRY